MFFYVDDIVFAYKVDRQHAAELLISKLKDIFEMKNLDTLKFFLRMRVIQRSDVIYLVQDAYAEKLIKKYEISINQKTSSISLCHVVWLPIILKVAGAVY
jgi:chlorite dismutase